MFRFNDTLGIALWLEGDAGKTDWEGAGGGEVQMHVVRKNNQ